MGALDDMQDLIGHVRLWPMHILQIIFTERYHYTNRIKIVTFFYNNGVNEDFMFTFCNEIPLF